MVHLGEQKKEARRKELLAEIFGDPGIMIRDLAERLNVSRETIRRDLDALCARGELQRRYGGAVFTPVGNILSFDARQDRHIPERRAIAAKAHDLLQDNQVIMLGPGTTALLFASELAATEKQLTVITNGLREALTLAGNDRLRVVLAPGELDRLKVSPGARTPAISSPVSMPTWRWSLPTACRWRAYRRPIPEPSGRSRP